MIGQLVLINGTLELTQSSFMRYRLRQCAFWTNNILRSLTEECYPHSLYVVNAWKLLRQQTKFAATCFQMNLFKFSTANENNSYGISNFSSISFIFDVIIQSRNVWNVLVSCLHIIWTGTWCNFIGLEQLISLHLSVVPQIELILRSKVWSSLILHLADTVLVMSNRTVVSMSIEMHSLQSWW